MRGHKRYHHKVGDQDAKGCEHGVHATTPRQTPRMQAQHADAFQVFGTSANPRPTQRCRNDMAELSVPVKQDFFSFKCQFGARQLGKASLGFPMWGTGEMQAVFPWCLFETRGPGPMLPAPHASGFRAFLHPLFLCQGHLA